MSAEDEEALLCSSPETRPDGDLHLPAPVGLPASGEVGDATLSAAATVRSSVPPPPPPLPSATTPRPAATTPPLSSPPPPPPPGSPPVASTSAQKWALPPLIRSGAKSPTRPIATVVPGRTTGLIWRDGVSGQRVPRVVRTLGGEANLRLDFEDPLPGPPPAHYVMELREEERAEQLARSTASRKGKKKKKKDPSRRQFGWDDIESILPRPSDPPRVIDTSDWVPARLPSYRSREQTVTRSTTPPPLGEPRGFHRGWLTVAEVNERALYTAPVGRPSEEAMEQSRPSTSTAPPTAAPPALPLTPPEAPEKMSPPRDPRKPPPPTPLQQRPTTTLADVKIRPTPPVLVLRPPPTTPATQVFATPAVSGPAAVLPSTSATSSVFATPAPPPSQHLRALATLVPGGTGRPGTSAPTPMEVQTEREEETTGTEDGAEETPKKKRKKHRGGRRRSVRPVAPRVPVGTQFANVAALLADPEVDPPAGACFNCWGRDHERRECPAPRERYCYNCGRRGVPCPECPRCREGYPAWNARKRGLPQPPQSVEQTQQAPPGGSTPQVPAPTTSATVTTATPEVAARRTEPAAVAAPSEAHIPPTSESLTALQRLARSFPEWLMSAPSEEVCEGVLAMMSRWPSKPR